MNMQKKRNILLPLAVSGGLVLAPIMGAGAQDYLQGKTYYEDPVEIAKERVVPEGDESQAYKAYDPATEEWLDEMVEYKIEHGLSNGSHFHGEGAPMDAEAFNALLQEAQAGNGAAIGLVAQAYHYGYGVNRDETTAIEWYRRAIDYGQVEHYSTIGDMYREQPTQQGGFLGRIFGSGSSGVEKSDAVAREWYEKGVKAGDWRSHLQLGIMYRDGLGGMKSKAKAEGLYNHGLALKKKANENIMKQVKAQMRKEVEQEAGLSGAPKEGHGHQH